MLSVRGRFWLWTGVVAVLAAVFVFGVSGRLRVETDILAMLPEVDRDPVVENSVRALSDTTGRRTLFLVGAPEFAAARDAAQDFYLQLKQSGAFAEVRLDLEYRSDALVTLYAPYAAGLLSDTHRQWLQAGQSGRLVQESLRALYSPLGGLRPQAFAQDPLNLLGDFLAQQIPAAGKLRLHEGVLTVRDSGLSHVLVTAESGDSPFSIEQQQRIVPVIAAAQEALKTHHPGARVLSSGVIRHAAANSERATREISAFGSLSLVGVILLVLLTFRAIRPLVLTLLSVGVGAMAALVTCHFLFEKVHLVTLVFGSTLIGVAVDYSIHYFSDQFRHTGTWDPQLTLKHVGPAILIGMLATVLGYQAFLLPPFPGLRQMAVFSVAGVAAACACVLLWYPRLANRKPATHQPLMLQVARRLGSLSLGGGLRGPVLAVSAVLMTLIALGLYRLEFVDDIRTLQSSPDWLQQEEIQAREILGGANDTRFFLVEGATPELLLQAEEALREGLNERISAGDLAGYQAVSRALPSQKRQAENRQLMAQQVYAPGGALPRLQAELGYPRDTIERQSSGSALAKDSPALLAPEVWLASPASAALRGLWLGPMDASSGQVYASAVTLGGIHNLAALQALDERLPGARFIDRVDKISAVMGRYRRIASFCLAGAYAVIGLVLVLRYGAAPGLLLLAAPVGAAVLTLAAFGLLGVAVNLFNILALLLVLGMGVDYAVFLREGGGARATVLMAIMLAGLMTLLAFGMLAFSATPFIRSIGLTVLLGVSFTFALALLCSAPSARTIAPFSQNKLPHD